jgi:hypothetical protein
VAQGVYPEFKPQYHKKKKKRVLVMKNKEKLAICYIEQKEEI